MLGSKRQPELEGSLWTPCPQDEPQDQRDEICILRVRLGHQMHQKMDKRGRGEEHHTGTGQGTVVLATHTHVVPSGRQPIGSMIDNRIRVYE